MLNLSKPSPQKGTIPVKEATKKTLQFSDFGKAVHCKSCAANSARRIPRTTFERCLSQIVTFKAYRCDNCHQRFLKRV